MKTTYGSLSASQSDENIEIDNGRILVRLLHVDGGYAQEFYAIDRKCQPRLILSSLHKNLILSSQHRVCSSPMISGERLHLFPICRESLRMTYSSAEISQHDDQRIVLQLTGATQGHSLQTKITMENGSNILQVKVCDELQQGRRAPLIEYLMSSFAFTPDGMIVPYPEVADFVWAPNLRPGNDHIIGDSAFYSPAVILKKGGLSAALMPDLNILAKK